VSDFAASIRRAFTASARAIEIRWRWPPENSCGNFVAAEAVKPTSDSSSLTRPRSARSSIDRP
jgi:hypothetical protein